MGRERIGALLSRADIRYEVYHPWGNTHIFRATHVRRFDFGASGAVRFAGLSGLLFALELDEGLD